LVAYEDLRIKNLVKITVSPNLLMMQVGISSENGWSILELSSGRITVAVNPSLHFSTML
jgi:hypothetical protein